MAATPTLPNLPAAPLAPVASFLRTDVTLEDKYTLAEGRVFATGTQALVRLAFMQRERDLLAGLNTAGFISGYRGSPLGGLDQALWKAKKHLKNYHIEFTPGVNEELAATAVWGSQQVGLFGDAKYDGVFAMWYGKGPGVDRSGDVFKHANAAGTSQFGGVLLVAGDDHACKSSTLPHQSEHAFDAAMIPVLYPTGVQEIIELGLHGFAMSRYSGCYVAFKVISETVDSSASISIDPRTPEIKIPTEFKLPVGGVHIRWPDPPMEQEQRLQHDKIYAAIEYCRVNKLNRITLNAPTAKLGIIASGKSYLDVLQALEDLGIGESQAAEIGIRLYKVAMPWPLEPTGVREFAEGLEEILVVEEKRQLIEYQLKEQLYNWKENVRPKVVGKYDESGEWDRPAGTRAEWLLPAVSELTPAMIARVIAGRIAKFYTSPVVEARLKFLQAKEAALALPREQAKRIPYFCSGCPHNTSTKVPEGSKALAGIGCHYMATWVRPKETMTFTQMGGEGVPWIGIQPFTKTNHVFANLGDGTYFHSGLLAIRAAVAANVNLTYKILYNDAVAMTGGQPIDGTLHVWQITQQVHAEGINRIALVSDDPGKYVPGTAFAPGTTLHHRDELDAVQKELREIPGVSVLVYDQTCAAEKRRRRKRGTFPDPQKRIVINDQVCEGCGDCGKKSNCLSVVPVETEFGRKRAIDQSSCNKDYSCVNGFCPSFVSVNGGKLRKKKPALTEVFGTLPTPVQPSIDRPYGILVTGVGGTGVVTIGAILGMAAHLENKGVALLDMTGLAQKGGSVYSHIRVAKTPAAIHAVRIAAGEAALVLGCDMLVAASDEAIAKMNNTGTVALVNSDLSTTGEFTKNPDLQMPGAQMRATITDAVGAANTHFVDASKLATALMGDSIATNFFMVGYAIQLGLIPISVEAINSAIELNGASIESNKKALEWGRRAAHDLRAVERAATPPEAKPEHHKLSESLDEIIARRIERLTAYQNADYARQYSEFVSKVRSAESGLNSTKLAENVARYLFKLMAIKDEWEVARLYAETDFLKRIEDQFEGDYQLNFYLAPPLISKRNDKGELIKTQYGPWVLKAFKMMAKFKHLRGSWIDWFSKTDERKMERQLLADYRTNIEGMLGALNKENHGVAVEIAGLPEFIRGFGHVKEANVHDVQSRLARLQADFKNPPKKRGIDAIAIKVAA